MAKIKDFDHEEEIPSASEMEELLAFAKAQRETAERLEQQYVVMAHDTWHLDFRTIARMMGYLSHSWVSKLYRKGKAK